MNIAPLKDFAPAIALWNRCVQAGEVLYAPMDDNLFAQKFVHNAGCDPDLLLGAEIDGQLAGLIHGVAPGMFPGSRPEIGYLTVVLADSAWRGQGVGRALLEACRAEAQRRGCTSLELSVWCFNQEAVAFYQHCGYATRTLRMECPLSKAQDNCS